MAEARGTNSASFPLKRARTRRMISALSTRVAGSATPGFDRCNSGKLKNSFRRAWERELRYHTPHWVRDGNTGFRERRAIISGGPSGDQWEEATKTVYSFSRRRLSPRAVNWLRRGTKNRRASVDCVSRFPKVRIVPTRASFVSTNDALYV